MREVLGREPRALTPNSGVAYSRTAAMISRMPSRPRKANASRAIMSTGSFTSLVVILHLDCLQRCDRRHLLQ